MQTNSAKPLGYYCSDHRDTSIMNAIALEFGDHFEFLSDIQISEALIILAMMNRLEEPHIELNYTAIALPRKFTLLVGQLSRDGWLAVSIVLNQSLRDRLR